MLKVENLRKMYRSGAGVAQVLDGVDLRLGAGESLALMGESGSGKSTLLHLVAGLDVPDAGVITLDGAEMSEPRDTVRAGLRREKIGVVFQQFNLVPSLDVASNIAFQAHLSGRHDADWCARLAERMGLTDHLGKYPEALSGGQQQRVAIARALAARPKLLLADEPTGNLDENTAQAVMELLLELTGETGTALLMVTHSPRHAAALGRQATLRSGKIV